MTEPNNRTAHLHVRCTAEEKAEIKTLAQIAKTDMSKFVLSKVLHRCKRC